MKKTNILYRNLLLLLGGMLAFSCKPDPNEQTILKGHARIICDEEIFPIVEDAYWVFRSQYPAEITFDSLPESEAVNALLSGRSDIAILTRKLSKTEENAFTSKGTRPRITPFAKDAVVFLTHPASKDTVADMAEVVALLQGKPSRISKLVFENPNSGTVRFMDSVAGVKKGPKANVYSLPDHEAVLKYIADNPGAVAVTGLNAMVQPYPNWEKYAGKVKVMAVRNVKTAKGENVAVKPSQANIATGSYPLTRTLYVLNYQGKAGLGTGFASYIAGQDGQRLILKSGLLPLRIPPRILNIRKEINAK